MSTNSGDELNLRHLQQETTVVVVAVVVLVRGSRRTQCISTNAYELIVHPATPASEGNYDELTTCVESHHPYHAP